MSTNLEAPLERFATEFTGVLILNLVGQRLRFLIFIFGKNFSVSFLCNFLRSKRYGHLEPFSSVLSKLHSVVYRAIILLLSYLDSFIACAVISFYILFHVDVLGLRGLIAAGTIF